MRVGVGLPAALPGAPGALVLDWARAADAGPFTSLGVVDRVLYDCFEPLTALAAVAGATSRVRLATTIVIGPLRSTALLVKTAASLDSLASGRLVLGLAVGARRDDYAAVGVPYSSRGRCLEEQLLALREHFCDGSELMGPGAVRQRGPELLIGGLSDAAFARAARYADGYVHGGGPPRAFARAADKARAAWSDAQRPGRPALWAQGYFALGGESARRAGEHYLRSYYGFTGEFVERIVAELLTTPQAIAQFLRGYEDAGCDEIVLFPTVAALEQLELLAEVLIALGRAPTLEPGPESARRTDMGMLP